MGKLFGSRSFEPVIDHPDLNKCPDCDCFFAGDNCPLCGKECPEHMRAGNRPAPKAEKPKKNRSRIRGVKFIDWYHTWWFIILMMFVFPILGIVLLITSPHEKWKKAVFIGVTVLYMAFSTFGINYIISNVSEIWSAPVNTSLTKEEYMAKCQPVTAEQFYRTPDEYTDSYVCIKVKITAKVTYVDSYNLPKDYVCYLGEGENGSEFKLILRDCLLADKQRFVPGDVITVYGEGAGEAQAYDAGYTPISAPCLNMAYVGME